MKRIMWFMLLFVLVMIGTTSESYAQIIDDGSLPLNRDITTKITVPPFQLINRTNHDFGYDYNKALKWSNDNYPITYNDFNEDIDVINKKLRVKYLNRSEYYDHHENLDRIDNQFITVLSEPVYLYSNFSSSDFGINANLFSSRRKEIYDYMIKDTEYGIDHGYFKGTLTPQPLSDKKNEPIQIKLFVPAGTKVLRIGDINNPEYLLQREQSLFYQNKDLKLDVDGNLNIQITATLIDRKIISDEVDFQEDLIYHSLKNSYEYSNPVTLIPLGLNAGFILNESSNILETFFEKLNTEKYLDYSSDINYTMANGFWVHGNSFSEATVGMNFEERKDFFSKKFNITSLGQTATGGDYISSTILTLSFLNELNDTNATIFDSFMNTLFHEYFHYLIYDTDNFKNRKLFDDKEYDFLSYSEYLFKQESNELCAILDSDYAQTDPEEFMCESFMTKYHTNNVVKTEFNDNIKETNRFLDNLYDFDPPSSPTNLNEISVDGNNATLSFEHSSDNVSVDKYVIYKRKYNDEGDFQPCKTILTKKDENGLSSANPSDEESDVTVTIEQLEQNTEYEFYIIAVDEALNESDPSNVLKVKTKDTEPPELNGSLSGSALTSSFSRLSWRQPTDNVGVEQIRIRRTQSDLVQIPLVTDLFSSDQIFTVSGNATNYIDYTIEKGKRYTYTMTALDAAGNESNPSNSVVIQSNDDDDRKQNEDKAQNTSSTSTTLDLGGLFPGIGTGVSSGFKLFGWLFSPLGWVFHSEDHVNLNQELYTIDNLLPDQSYLFLVVPVDNEGNPLDDGVKINVDTPSVEITDLQVIETKRTLIQLSWTGVDLPKESVSYEVYRNDQKIDTIDGTKQHYVDMDLEPGTTYQYQIKPKIESGLQTKPSEKVRGETLAPYEEQIIRLASTFSVYDGQVITFRDTVNLEPFENRETQFIHLSYNQDKKAYQLKTKEQTQVLGVSDGQVKQVISSENEYEDHQYWKIKDSMDDFVKLENVNYCDFVLDIFQENIWAPSILIIKPVEVARDSQLFKVLQDTEPPTAPKNLTASTITDHSVSLSWELSEDDVGVMYYDIYQGSKRVSRVDEQTSEKTITNINSLNNYHFTVKAVDGSNNESQSSNIVQVNTLPKAPKNLEATNITESTVTLSWESDETSSLVNGYEIYQNDQLIDTVSNDQLTYTDKNLTSAADYRYTIKTKTVSLVSEDSNEITVQTKPKAPKNLEATNITESTVTLSWESDETSSLVNGYEIYQNDQLIDTKPKGELSYLVTNLNPGTSYNFKIRTKLDTEIFSQFSDTLTVTTEEDLGDKDISINLSTLVEGFKGPGYHFTNNILRFNQDANSYRYILSTENESDKSIIIDSNVKTQIRFNNISIKSRHAITIGNNSEVLILLEEKSENKIISTEGIGISGAFNTKIVIDSDSEEKKFGKLIVESTSTSIGGTNSDVFISDRADIVAISYDDPAIVSKNKMNLGTGKLISFSLYYETMIEELNRVIYVCNEIWENPSSPPKVEILREISAPKLLNKTTNISYTVDSSIPYTTMYTNDKNRGDIYNIDTSSYTFIPRKELSPQKSNIAY